jgi:caffeoyl-CoA O-methyltransferase
MHFLAKSMGVKKAIEVGTFTGYSSICIARALPAGGKLVCIDQSDEFTRVARRYWEEDGLAKKIDLRLGDGLDMLDRMIASGEGGAFDFCFHDADKARSAEYVERFLTLLKPGGVFLVDNALRDGDVAKPKKVNKSDGTRAIDTMNRRLHDDDRIDWCLLPIGDGVAMGRKR